jgi:ferredoxin
MIRFQVKDTNGFVRDIEIPTDINLSLMEVLKASEYNILATCGGMALCATCHVDVETGLENLGDPTPSELDMIDTLPNAKSNSRLACQIKINERVQGCAFRLMESEQ